MSKYARMFTPSDDILERYADVLVRYALHGGEGVRKNEVVQVMLPDAAKPLYGPLLVSLLKAGAFPKMHLLPTGVDALFYENANEEQLMFFPRAFKKSEADLIDHQISVIAETNPQELRTVDPDKIFRSLDARHEYREWLFEKERQEKFTWTLALYGTAAMAKEADLTEKEYWDQIMHACYLDMQDPVGEWRKLQKEQERLRGILDGLKIDRVHVEAADIDLWVKIGGDRCWLGGSGRNIPSYELFVSPDWRGTEGTIAFNQPLYRYGNILRGIKLRFEKGEVVEATAEEGQSVLTSMISRENAKKVGEFSLTDARFSRITKFMANTLYDENIGGAFGNTHIALGRAYRESYNGDLKSTPKKTFDALGFNDSPEHTDIISTTDRTVTAYLPDGSSRVIFKNGSFTL